MNRSPCVVASLVLACAALAAPAPKPQPFVTGWENPVDPDRDCKLKREKGTLVIEMPGSDHDYNPIRGQFNAPRLFRERDIDGDFVMQVRVRIDCRPFVQSTVAGQPSFVSAGFLVILPDNFCIRMEFGVSRKGSRKDGYAALIKWVHKKRQGGPFFLENGWKGDPYLRLERQDRDLSFSISSDGENWTPRTTTVGLPAKLKVGLAAYSTSSAPSKIQFDQFKLTLVRKKKR